ncbi:hypothetical protein [Aquabacterium sp.]|uniref:hypothetical protein n=1 Tax=Aquabacterium sp. TaxID=1872578 RepID=UPI004037BE2B
MEPKLKYGLGSTTVRAEARLRWLDQEGQRQDDAEFRELSLSGQGWMMAWRLGAQQVNWGRMDILRVIDTLNPVDQHDVFYLDVPETKRSLPMANLEWQFDADTLQFIVAPVVPVDKLPREVSGLPVSINKPDSSVKNATVAVRYGFENAGWNADVIAVKGWNATPILTPRLGAHGPYLEGTLRRHDRLGFSADKPIGGFVLRLEGVYSLLGSEARSRTPLERRLELGAGADIRWGPWFLAVQALGELKLNHEPLEASRRGTSYLSAILQRKWAQDRINTRVVHITDTQDHASWNSLQASYEIDARQEIKLQADFFRGRSTVSFGAFNARSRVAISHRLEY